MYKKHNFKDPVDTTYATGVPTTIIDRKPMKIKKSEII